MRGKAWSIDEERLLRQLVQEGKGTQEISQIMGKSRVVAAGQKCAVAAASSPAPAVESTPVIVVEPAPAVMTFDGDVTVLKSNEPLPSVEEKLQALAAALRALERPGLRPAEISRLRNIIEGVKVYEQLFARYVNYRAIEDELVEVRRQLASERRHE